MGEARAGGVARALGHSVTTVQMLGGDRTHTFAHSFKQLDCSTGLLWGAVIQDLGLRTPRLLTPNIFWKITVTPPPSNAPVHLLPLTPGTGSWLCSQEGGRRPAEGGGVCVGRGASCPVLQPWDSC